jgi:hypothetical protein
MIGLDQKRIYSVFLMLWCLAVSWVEFHMKLDDKLSDMTEPNHQAKQHHASEDPQHSHHYHSLIWDKGWQIAIHL